MKKTFLNVTFHNPNSSEEFEKAVVKAIAEANTRKAEDVIFAKFSGENNARGVFSAVEANG